eukprot:TRINITY_DN21427_c0_g1_i1.p1 TRINITY_DN21427_c0_g1~~TRINITY_DN21427_c0_g1_i1.p1  ORF type:complete len:1283 (+),score=341.56 TRINITY_DN21427_c0_g1_i1:123-3851(+)
MSGGPELTWCGRDMKHLDLTARRPCLAYCLTCGSFCLVFILWIVLIIAAPGFFPFSTDVPLYLRDDTQQQYGDAVIAGQRDAKFSPTGTGENLPRSVTVREEGDDLEVELIYVPSEGDVFELRHMQTIRDIEQRVMQLPFWRKYCALDWDGRAQNASQQYEQAVQRNEYAKVAEFKTQEFLDRMPCRAPSSPLWGCMCPEGTHTYLENGIFQCRSAGPGRVVTGCDVRHPWPRAPNTVAPSVTYSTPAKPDPRSPGEASIPGYPPGVLDCRRPEGCQGLGDSNALFEPIDSNYVQQAVSYYSRSDPFDDWSVFRFVFGSTDSGFGGGSSVGAAIRTVFTIGLPIAGYESADTDQESQIESISEDIFDDVHEYLFGASFPDLAVWFDGPDLLSVYISKQIIADGSWALGSMLFVWLYIVVMNGSWFLGTMGMGQILMAFAPAYMIYFMIGFRYFGTFNVLTIFIILGIGADDIFVMLDTWNQSELEIPSSGEDLSMLSPEEREEKVSLRRLTRMSWTWKRAARAMLVTSSTTMASFLCTGTSSFPGIQTFGVFAAMLVLCNYTAVILYYPTVVALHDAEFKDKRFCCGLVDLLKRLHLWINTQTEVFTKDVRDKWEAAARAKENHDRKEAGLPPKREESAKAAPELSDAPGSPEADAAAAGHGELRGIELFFYKQYSGFIVRFKWPILVCMIVFIVMMIVFMAQLEPDPDPPQLFPKSNNYGGYRDTKAAHFARGGSIYAIKLRLVSGFDPSDPIDRGGTSSTDPDDVGDPVWAQWQGPAEQRRKPGQYTNWFPDLVPEGLPCFEHLCNAAVQRDDVRKVGGLPEYPIECWVTAFRSWIEGGQASAGQQGPTHTWAQITGKADGVDYDGDGIADGAAYWDRTNNRWVPHPKPAGWQDAFWSNLLVWLSNPETYDIWKKYLYGQKTPWCFDYPQCAPGVSENSNLSTGCCNDPSDSNCACPVDNAVFRFHYAEMKLTASIKVTFDKGLDLRDAWMMWLQEQMKQAEVCRQVCSGGMHNRADPVCATPVFVTDDGAFAYFKVQEVMAKEAFQGIGISLALAFAVITLATMNVIMAFWATAIIACIVISVIGITVSIGWKLGIVQAIVYVMVPGMAVDYVAHLTEAYTEVHATKRNDRVRLMLTEVGISVVSGAMSTLGASLFLFAPVITFFNQFGLFMFMTISLSLGMALLLFPAIMAICGPEGRTGSFKHLLFKDHDSAVVPAEEPPKEQVVAPGDGAASPASQ